MHKIKILFLFLLFHCCVQAAHVRGFEMNWECITSGADSGKFVFNIKGYRLCSGGALSSYIQVYNPLYSTYGGVSVINLGLLPGSLGQIDLAPTCYDSTLQRNCYNVNENAGIYDQFIYRSSPVLILGVPDVNGSTFMASIAGGPTAVNITSAGGIVFQVRMFPHINPNTGAPDTLGTVGHPSCYDSSPKYAETVPFLSFIGVMNYHSNSCSDIDGDQLSYAFDSVRSNSTSYYTYTSGYSGSNPFPNTTHHAGNVPLSLDSNTGNFTFLPYAPLGNFLIGHKTSSYRNGQKIAEVYRTYIMLLDSVPNDKYNRKNKPPKISFKNHNAANYSSSYSDTFSIGQVAHIKVKAEDFDSLKLHTLQSVSLRLIPQPYQIDPLNPNNCTYIHCAFLDTVNTSWKNEFFQDTGVVIADFYLNVSCDHLGALNPNSITGPYKTYDFSFVAKDNICPFPLTTIASISITVHDSTESRNKIQLIEAVNDDNKIAWPKYNFTRPFTFYKVFRSNALSGTYDSLYISYSILDTSFLDTTSMATQRPYFYKIETAASLSCNPNTNVIRSLHLNTTATGGMVSLIWNDLTHYQSDLNSGIYKIYSDTGSGFQLRDSLPFGSYDWNDHAMPCGTKVKYYISAFDQTNDVRFISNIDSVYTAYHKLKNISICPGDSIFLAGIWRKNPGIFLDTTAATSSCDSIIENTLTVDSSFQISQNQYICNGDSIKIGGLWRSQAGVYPQIFQTIKGCDSVINHELFLNPVYEEIKNVTICQGDSIYDSIFQSYFAQNGTYTKSDTSFLGCDSNYVLSIDETSVNTNVGVSSNVLTAQLAGALYQWYDCVTGQMIPGASGRIFMPTKNGAYQVLITLNGCSEFSDCIDVVGIGLVEKAASPNFRIFPNPTYGKFIIEFDDPQQGELIIYNSIGDEVQRQNLQNSRNFEVNLKESLNSGIYHVLFIGKKIRASQHVVLRREFGKE